MVHQTTYEVPYKVLERYWVRNSRVDSATKIADDIMPSDHYETHDISNLHRRIGIPYGRHNPRPYKRFLFEHPNFDANLYLCDERGPYIPRPSPLIQPYLDQADSVYINERGQHLIKPEPYVTTDRTFELLNKVGYKDIKCTQETFFSNYEALASDSEL